MQDDRKNPPEIASSQTPEEILRADNLLLGGPEAFGIPTFKARSTAWLIDLVFSVFVMYEAIATLTRLGHINQGRWPVDVFFTFSIPMMVICFGFLVLTFFLTRVLSVALWGKSLGKMIFGLEVIDVRTGGPPSFDDAWGRTSLILLGDVFGSAVIATAFFHPERRHVADLMFHTRVIDRSASHHPVPRRPVLAVGYLLAFCAPFVFVLPGLIAGVTRGLHWDRHRSHLIYYIDLPDNVSRLNLRGLPGTGESRASDEGSDVAAGPEAARGAPRSADRGAARSADRGADRLVAIQDFSDPKIEQTDAADFNHCRTVISAIRTPFPVVPEPFLSSYCRCLALNIANLASSSSEDPLEGLAVQGFDAQFRQIKEIQSSCLHAVTAAPASSATPQASPPVEPTVSPPPTPLSTAPGENQ